MERLAVPIVLQREDGRAFERGEIVFDQHGVGHAGQDIVKQDGVGGEFLDGVARDYPKFRVGRA